MPPPMTDGSKKPMSNRVKKGAIQVLHKAKFEVRKWHSSVIKLESDDEVSSL